MEQTKNKYPLALLMMLDEIAEGTILIMAIPYLTCRRKISHDRLIGRILNSKSFDSQFRQMSAYTHIHLFIMNWCHNNIPTHALKAISQSQMNLNI